MTKSTAYLIIAITMPLLAVSVAYGQEGDAAEAATSEPIDEIIVSVPQSLATLRRQMDNAQDETFAVFNAMIDEPDFHITCRMQRPYKDGFDPIPVHGEIRVCATRYHLRESQRSNDDYLDGFGDGQVTGASAHKKELTQKINKLITESPEFRQAMSEYVVSKREYDTAKEQEMSRGFFSRLFGSEK
jgi:hypothetical protein